MIKVIFDSKKPGPFKRFVGPGANGEYRWCEQSTDDPRYDLRQGRCNLSDLPDSIANICNAHTGSFYACEWPLI